MVSLESRCAVKNGALEAHPVWGYKNIKGGGVGVGRGAGAENRSKISVVLGLVSQTGSVCVLVRVHTPCKNVCPTNVKLEPSPV